MILSPRIQWFPFSSPYHQGRRIWTGEWQGAPYFVDQSTSRNPRDETWHTMVLEGTPMTSGSVVHHRTDPEPLFPRQALAWAEQQLGVRGNDQLLLRTTLLIARHDREPVTPELRDRVIHALIDQNKGVQDVALGTVVIPVFVGELEDEVEVQGWIHAWE